MNQPVQSVETPDEVFLRVQLDNMRRRAEHAERHANNMSKQSDQWMKAAMAYHMAATYYRYPDSPREPWGRARDLYLNALDNIAGRDNK